MPRPTRRSFLKAAGGVVGGSLVATGVASADGHGSGSTRFLIDLEEVSRSDVPDDVEIVHDISQIDVLAARGDPDAVPGAAVTPDLTAYQDGPVKEVPATDRESGGPAWDSGEPTNTELQWDKREQRVGDLTERPDNRRVVHDTTTGEGTRVAVVDSGVYDGHPDLADVVNAEESANYTLDPYDFRPNGAGDHGTHVAGIIAGTNADGEGVLGTAPDTEIVAHRVFSDPDLEEGGASTGDILAALADAADKGCDAANFSVGYTNYNVEENPDLLMIKAMYEDLADYAHEQGMTIVNSAGNDSVDMTQENMLSLPTEAEGIFGVAATGPIGFLWDDKQESREDKALKKLEEPTSYPANYTNYGSGVDVSAAGGNYDTSQPDGYHYDFVFSTIVTDDGTDDPEAGYGWKAGTSMSAPQVTGAYALVRSLRPDASAEEVEALIRETAQDAPGGEQYHGAGHLDLRRLVKRADTGGRGRGGGPGKSA